MLIALNLEGERIQGDDAIKGDKYLCQQCNQQVITKKGRIKVHHFAHYPDSSPCVWWEPESKKHLTMKNTIMELLKRDNPNITFAEFEYKVGFSHHLYPDVYVRLSDGKRIAIECQVSNKPLDDFVIKTIRYSRIGIYVLWIFSDDNYVDKEYEEEETRVSDIRLRSHYWNYGRIYVLDDDDLLAVHFSGVERYNNWRFYYYNLKKTKNTSTNVCDSSRLLCIERPDSIKVARFYDKRWWGE